MTDERDSRRQRKAALLEDAKIKAGVSATMDTAHGRAFLWWLLAECGVFHQSHSPNALNTAFACGKREVGLLLIERIGSVDPAGFVRMQMERIENVNAVDDGSRSAGTITSEFSGTDSDESGL
jgi:hypothetical protein